VIVRGRWAASYLSETVQNPFRYASYYYDSASGLYYLWHRYYDPGTTRFLTLDPTFLLTAQTYTYCGGNPTTLADPTGLASWSGALDWVNENLNPVYLAINGYANAVSAALNGKSWWTSFSYGMQGALGVADTALIATGGAGFVGGLVDGIDWASLAARFRGIDWRSEAGFIDFGAGSGGKGPTFTRDVKWVYDHLEDYHGIDRNLAGERLHAIKPGWGVGAAEDVVFDLTGNVYDAVTGEWIGSLTAGGAR